MKLENLGRCSIDVENQKAALEATLQMTTQEKESLRSIIKEKDLMSVDKAPLTQLHKSIDIESLRISHRFTHACHFTFDRNI